MRYLLITLLVSGLCTSVMARGKDKFFPKKQITIDQAVEKFIESIGFTNNDHPRISEIKERARVYMANQLQISTAIGTTHWPSHIDGQTSYGITTVAKLSKTVTDNVALLSEVNRGVLFIDQFQPNSLQDQVDSMTNVATETLDKEIADQNEQLLELAVLSLGEKSLLGHLDTEELLRRVDVKYYLSATDIARHTKKAEEVLMGPAYAPKIEPFEYCISCIKKAVR